MNFTQQEMGPGVRLYLCPTDKFKTLTCKVFIQQDLQPREAAQTALVPLLLRRGSQRFPTTGDIASRPYGEGGFFEPYFQQERHNLVQELEGLINDKRTYAVVRCTALMCAQEPFGIYKYGDADTVRSLTAGEVYAHYQKLLAGYPLDIFVVGSQAKKAAEILAGLIQGRDGQQKLQPPQRVEVEENMDVQQAVLVMGYRTKLTYPDGDYYSLLVGNGLLGGFAHSKLFINVREKASLAYYVSSSLEGSKGLLTITAGISGEQKEQAVEIIQRQVRDVQEGRISAQELEQTKRGLISSMRSMQDNPSSLVDRNLIGIVHEELRSIEEVVEAIEAVTLDSVVRAMGHLQLDTTYILRPSPQKGAGRGTD